MNCKPRGGIMLTHTGRRVNPCALVPADICIEDIAHALSMQCRFAGHVNKFYSVAEHSVRVSAILPDQFASIPLRGLLHDASEAYLVDLPRPVKNYDPTFAQYYKQLEEEVMQVIFAAFDLPPTIPEAVKEADDVMLVTEFRELHATGEAFAAEFMPNVEPLACAINPWHPELAEQMFLETFDKLWNKYQH